MDSLKIVRGALWDVRSKWESIGIELSISKYDIEAIKKDRGNDVGDCLVEIISKYLKRVNPEPSWNSIVCALEAKAVGETQLAQELKRKYMECMAPEQQIDVPKVHVKEEQHFEEESLTSQVAGRVTDQSDSVTDMTFPFLDVKNLTKREKKDLKQKLSKEYKEILMKFANFEASISESLDRRNFRPEKIVNRALSLALYKSDDIPRPLLAEEQKILEEAITIDEVFIFLKTHKLISYFNYGILKHIAEVDGTKEDKEKLEEYEKDFVEFCRRKVYEVPNLPIVSESASSSRREFKVLIIADMKTTLNDVAAAERRIADILNLPHSAVELHEITLGSLILTLSIPIQIAEKLFPLKDIITHYDPHCPIHLAVFRKVESKSTIDTIIINVH